MLTSGNHGDSRQYDLQLSALRARMGTARTWPAGALLEVSLALLGYGKGEIADWAAAFREKGEVMPMYREDLAGATSCFALDL